MRIECVSKVHPKWVKPGNIIVLFCSYK